MLIPSDTFAVNSPGMYTMEAFFGAGCTLPDTIQVVAGKNVAFEQGPDTIVCNLNYSLNSGLSDTSNTYRWAHNVNLDMPNIVVTTSGLYQLTVLSPDGCSFTDDVNIRLRTPPNVTTQPNYDFCAGDSVLVDPQIQTASILYWSDPRLAGATIAFKQPGDYYVHVLDNTTGCRDTSYFTITEVPIPSFTLGPDTNFGRYIAMNDTIISSKNYKKYYYGANTSTVNTHIGYLREDTVAKKVYYLDKTSLIEDLIFDFSLNVGDSIYLNLVPTMNPLPKGF